MTEPVFEDFGQAPPIPPRHSDHKYKRPRPNRPTIIIPKSRYSPLSARVHKTPPPLDQHPAFRTPTPPTTGNPARRSVSEDDLSRYGLRIDFSPIDEQTYSMKHRKELDQNETKHTPQVPKKRSAKGSLKSSRSPTPNRSDTASPSETDSSGLRSRSSSSPHSSPRSSRTSNSTYRTSFLPSPIPKFSKIAPQEISYIWSHASLLHSVVHYNETLRTFQHLQQRDGIPRQLMPRIWINIGILHDRLKEYSQASDAFESAIQASTDGSLEQALGMFVMGCAQFEAGQTRKAAEYFEQCEAFFKDGPKVSAASVNKKQSDTIDLHSIGLNYSLCKSHVRSNKNMSLDAAGVAQRMQMKSAVQWRLHTVPDEFIIEAPLEEMDQEEPTCPPREVLTGNHERHEMQRTNDAANKVMSWYDNGDEEEGERIASHSRGELKGEMLIIPETIEEKSPEASRDSPEAPLSAPDELQALGNLLLDVNMASSPGPISPRVHSSRSTPKPPPEAPAVHVDDIRPALKPTKTEAPSLYTGDASSVGKSSSAPSSRSNTRPSTPQKMSARGDNHNEASPKSLYAASVATQKTKNNSPTRNFTDPEAAAAEYQNLIHSGAVDKATNRPSLVIFPPSSSSDNTISETPKPRSSSTPDAHSPPILPVPTIPPHQRNMSAPEPANNTVLSPPATTPLGLSPTSSSPNHLMWHPKKQKRHTDEPISPPSATSQLMPRRVRASPTRQKHHEIESRVIYAAAADSDAAREALAQARAQAKAMTDAKRDPSNPDHNKLIPKVSIRYYTHPHFGNLVARKNSSNSLERGASLRRDKEKLESYMRGKDTRKDTLNSSISGGSSKSGGSFSGASHRTAKGDRYAPGTEDKEQFLRRMKAQGLRARHDRSAKLNKPLPPLPSPMRDSLRKLEELWEDAALAQAARDAALQDGGDGYKSPTAMMAISPGAIGSVEKMNWRLGQELASPG